MKKYLLFAFATAFSISGICQGNSNKSKNGNKGKSAVQTEVKTKKSKSSATVSTGKSSSNQPAKVRAAFQSDYPNAANVTWSKYRGDWTATFNSGLGRSTAVYHANGQRKDTRTVINRNQLPGNIWERVFQRDRVKPVGVVQIESPSLGTEIFRIASKAAGSRLQYLFYNANGERVQYDY